MMHTGAPVLACHKQSMDSKEWGVKGTAVSHAGERDTSYRTQETETQTIHVNKRQTQTTEQRK